MDKNKALKPCRSPYCECGVGKCSHPGFYDARHEEFTPPAQQEPVVILKGFDEYGPMLDWYEHWVNVPIGTKLYTTPPAAQRPWVGLTDVNAVELWQFARHDIVEFARAIEAKLKEKNT